MLVWLFLCAFVVHAQAGAVFSDRILETNYRSKQSQVSDVISRAFFSASSGTSSGLRLGGTRLSEIRKSGEQQPNASRLRSRTKGVLSQSKESTIHHDGRKLKSKGSNIKSKGSNIKSKGSKSKSKGSKSKSKGSSIKSKGSKSKTNVLSKSSSAGTEVHCPFPDNFGSFPIKGGGASTASASSSRKSKEVIILSASHTDCQGINFICPTSAGTFLSSHERSWSSSETSKSKTSKVKGKRKLRKYRRGKIFKLFRIQNANMKAGQGQSGSSSKGANLPVRTVLLPQDHPSCSTPSGQESRVMTTTTSKPRTTTTTKTTTTSSPLRNPERPGVCIGINDGIFCEEVGIMQGMCYENVCTECALADTRKFCGPETCLAGRETPAIEVDLSDALGSTHLVTHFLNKDEPQVNVIYAVQNYQTGSLETPPGFLTSFSTDNGATYRDVEPLDFITNLKVEGELPPNPGVSIKLPAPVAESVSQVGGGGDGLAPLILGRRVYYMNHHQSNVPLRCTLMNKQPAGQTTDCLGFPYRLSDDLKRTYYSGDAAVGYADRVNNRIYIPVNPDNGFDKVGVLCIHIPNNEETPELCPATGQNATKDGDITFTTDGLIEFQTPSGGTLARDVGFGFADQSTERLYFSHIYQRKMYCLDVANPNMPAPCKKNFPIEVSNIMLGRGEPIRMTVMPKTDRFIMKAVDATNSLSLQCWENPLDPSIDARPCSDWENQTITLNSGHLYQYESIPIPNARGIAIGFCVWPNDANSFPTCFHLDSGREANEGKLADAAEQLWENRPGAASDHTLQASKYSSLSFHDARVYFAMGAFTSDSFGCYDGRTGKKCENYGYHHPTRLYTYGLMVDVGSNGECIWAMGDRGILVSFSAADPSQECGSETPTVVFAAEDAYCGPDTNPERWTSVELLDAGSDDGDFDNATLTIFGADGSQVLAGTPIDRDITVDVSSLPVAGKTSTLRFRVELNGAAEGLYERADPPKISVQWEGPPPQVCFVAGDVDAVESNLDVCYDDVPQEYQEVDCSLPTCAYDSNEI